MDFRARRSASFEVSVNLNLALGLGKKVPTKVLQGDESVEALRSLLNSLTWKRWFYRLQLGFAFLAITGFVILLLLG